MYHRQSRSGRRSDGLYQARIHRRIEQRLADAKEASRPLSYAELRQRALEAKAHNCGHTFVHPEIMEHLLDLRERYLKLRELVEGHWSDAEKELGGGYSDRDLFLWSHGLNWHDRKIE